jgi:hypothetical protein
MTEMGQEERFAPPRLSARCGFRKETIVGVSRNERDAPKPDFCANAVRLPDPTLTSHSLQATPRSAASLAAVGKIDPKPRPKSKVDRYLHLWFLYQQTTLGRRYWNDDQNSAVEQVGFGACARQSPALGSGSR